MGAASPRGVEMERRLADAPDVATYLYQALDDDYPVMAGIADLLEHIETIRHRVERAMSFCHA